MNSERHNLQKNSIQDLDWIVRRAKLHTTEFVNLSTLKPIQLYATYHDKTFELKLGH